MGEADLYSISQRILELNQKRMLVIVTPLSTKETNQRKRLLVMQFLFLIN